MNLYINFPFATVSFNQVVIGLSGRQPLNWNLDSQKNNGHKFCETGDTSLICQVTCLNSDLRITETRRYKIWKSNLTRFRPTFPFLYFLKTSENLCFFNVFRGNRKGTLAWNRWRFWVLPNFSEHLFWI